MKPLFVSFFLCLILSGCQIPPPRPSTSYENFIIGVNFIDRIGKSGGGNGEFIRPMGISIDAQGLLYIANSGNHRVEVIDSNGNFRWEFGRFGRKSGEFDSPYDVAVDGQFQLYVSDTENNRIQRCNLVDRIFSIFVGENLSPATNLSISDEVKLDRPASISIDKNGNAYITDTWNHQVLKFDPRGSLKLKVGGFGWSKDQFRYPTGISVSEEGYLFVSDSGNDRIQKFDFSGNQVLEWGKSGSNPSQVRNPWGIAIDSHGNVFVVDRGHKSQEGNKRVAVFDQGGNFLAEFGTGILVDPVDVAVDKDGRVYVTDFSDNDLKVFKAIYGKE